jgi:hypothetical protein
MMGGLFRFTMTLLVLAAGFSGAGSADTTGLQPHDPCRLLTVGEVEAVLGPLAGPPYRAAGAVARPRGEDCRYEATDGRSIRVNVTWDGGAQFMSMMGAMAGMLNQAGLRELKLSDSSTAAGEWDQAQVNQCCEFNALRGDRVVTVDVAGSRAAIGQAAGLAALAVKRLDRLLDVDGAAGVKAAETRAALRPQRRNVCALLPRADAEAIAGTALIGAPKGDEAGCTYQWPLDGAGSTYELKLTVQWTDGFHEMRQVTAMVGQASSMIGLGGGASAQDRADVPPGGVPWDEFSQSIIGVMAVKNDVLASIESGPFRQDIARAFVERALVNLSK